MADLRALEDVCAFAEQKLSEIEGKHQSHLKWLEEKGLEIQRLLARGAKNGALKVSRCAHPKKAELEVFNDENAPPGQHAAAVETPAVIRKAKNFQEEAASALPTTSRHQQNVLRDLSSNTASDTRQPAKPGVASTPLTTRPSTRKCPQLQQESKSPGVQPLPESLASADAPKDRELERPEEGRVEIDVAEDPLSSQQLCVAAPKEQEPERLREGRLESTAPEADAASDQKRQESKALAEGKSGETEELDPPVYTRRSKRKATAEQETKESARKDGTRTRRGVASGTPEAEVAAQPAVKDALPAGKTSVARSEVANHSAEKNTEGERMLRGAERGAQQKEDGQKQEESAVGDDATVSEKEAVRPSGRVTRRMAKERGVELSALPSGLADGSEVSGRKRKKNRRRELDENAIREQTLQADTAGAKAVEEKVRAGIAQREESAEKKESEIEEQTLQADTADAKSPEEGADEGILQETESAQKESAIREKQTLQADAKTPEEGSREGTLQGAERPEKKESAIEEETAKAAWAGAKSPEAGTCEGSGQTEEGPENRGRQLNIEASESVAAIAVEETTVPETPQGEHVLRTHRPRDAKRSNEGPPGGRITRSGRARKSRAEASKEKVVSGRQETEGFSEGPNTELGVPSSAEIGDPREKGMAEESGDKQMRRGKPKKQKVDVDTEQVDPHNRPVKEPEREKAASVEASEAPAESDLPHKIEEEMKVEAPESGDEVLEKKRHVKKKQPAKGKRRAKKGAPARETRAANENEVLPEETPKCEALPIANGAQGEGSETEQKVDERLEREAALESPVSLTEQTKMLEGIPRENPTPLPTRPGDQRETRSASAKMAVGSSEKGANSSGTKPGTTLTRSAAKEEKQASESRRSPADEASARELLGAANSGLSSVADFGQEKKAPAKLKQVVSAPVARASPPTPHSNSRGPTAAVGKLSPPAPVGEVTPGLLLPAEDIPSGSYGSPTGQLAPTVLRTSPEIVDTRGSSAKRGRDERNAMDGPTKEAATPGSEGALTRSQSKLQQSAGAPEILRASPFIYLTKEKSPERRSSPTSARAEAAEELVLVEHVSGGNEVEPESPPTVDMDVCTTPPTTGPKEGDPPTTNRNCGKRKLSERRVLRSGSRSASKAQTSARDVSRPPLRRSPRLQVTSAEDALERKSERSAKKVRLSEGFAQTGELIDLENEDEDLMVEPNFAVSLDGLRRSVRKAWDGKSPSPDPPQKLSDNNRQSEPEQLGEERSFISSGSRRSVRGSPNEGAPQRVGVATRSGQKSARETPNKEASPLLSPKTFKTKSAQKSTKKSAQKSAAKSAHEKNSAGRPSFVSASEDAGFGGLASEADADVVQDKQRAKPSNLLTSSISSLLSFMTKKEPPGPPIPGNNKNNVKGSVKALEAAELARKEEAKRAEERERRKALLEKRKEEKQRELSVQSQAVPLKPVESAAEKKAAAPIHTTVIDQKLRRAIEHRSKLEDEKAKRLEEELRKKEEERRRKEADVMRRKRQREEEEKRERDEKRRRLEEAIKSRKELGEKQRVELEEKERKRRQQEEYERKQRAAEEEERKRKRKEKELEAERRRKEDEEKRAAKAKEREDDRKRQEGLFVRRKEDERNEKLTRPGGPKPLTPIKTFLAENAASARHTPFAGADKMMPPPKTTPSTHSLAENQHAASTFTAGQAGRVLNPEHASSSLAAKPFANPPSNLRVAGWEASKPKAPKTQFARLNLGRLETPPPIAAVESYEISPYKEESSDEEDEDEKEAKKPIPAWARKENLGPALRRQMGVDPDDVFRNMHVKTCYLDQVFGTKGSKKKKDFGRRSSSGNWLEDHLTWKEELQYKKGMGYI